MDQLFLIFTAKVFSTLLDQTHTTSLSQKKLTSRYSISKYSPFLSQNRGFALFSYRIFFNMLGDADNLQDTEGFLQKPGPEGSYYLSILTGIFALAR